MTTRAEVYRARAVECATIAASCVDDKKRATYAELAIQWQRAADRTEAIEHGQAA